MDIDDEHKSKMYDRIMQDCYIITRYLHTSYTDVLMMTPAERVKLLSFFRKENNELKERMARREEERRASKRRI